MSWIENMHCRAEISTRFGSEAILVAPVDQLQGTVVGGYSVLGRIFDGETWPVIEGVEIF